jgi:hypothetical protein
MKYTMNNYIIIFLIIILTVYKISKIIETNKIMETNKTKEPFISGINKIYRPYVRNIRLYSTNKWNTISNNSYVFFRRMGLL